MKKILIGFIAGAAVGMLYAPCSGAQARSRIKGAGRSAKNKWNRISDSVAGGIESVKDRVDQFADKAVEKVESTQFQTNGATM